MLKDDTRKFVTYQKYNFPEEASQLIELLEENEITYEWENTSPTFDITFSLNTSQNEFRLKVRAEDFLKIDELLKERALSNLSEIPADYYLRDFTDKELLELISKKEEWSIQDVIWAREILEKREIPISDKIVETLQEVHGRELREPESVPEGVFQRKLILAFFGNPLNILEGWSYWQASQTDPSRQTGEKMYIYDAKTRELGKRLMTRSIFFLFFWMLVVLYWLVLN
ncbi:MAG: hypothetical protein GC181_15850 [Bacteroidetes bacterium]|nr:hypothetical protein [Bacteroidota bacterium]